MTAAYPKDQLFAEFHRRVSGGAEIVVEVVELEGGAWRVQWGVDGLPSFECTGEEARRLARLLDAHAVLPSLSRLLVAAADRMGAAGVTVQ